MPHETDLVPVAEFNDPLTAHSIRLLLEANGVMSIVVGDTLMDAGLECIRLLVQRNDLELSEQIILEVPAAADILIPAWNCQCGEEVDEGFNTCWACGLSHPDLDQLFGI